MKQSIGCCAGILQRTWIWAAVIITAGCASTSQSPAPGSMPGAQPAPSAAIDPGEEIDKLQPDSGNLRAFMELARADLRLMKASIIAQNLPLTEEEAAAFWPVYREYEQDLAKTMDRKLAGIKKYFAAAGAMPEAQARELAQEAMDLEAKRTALKRLYFKKFQAGVPVTKVARFFQIDNQLNMLVDLRVAAALPLIR